MIARVRRPMCCATPGCWTARCRLGVPELRKRGRGKWITVYARNGHVFMTIAGLRFDTQGQGREDGPRWAQRPRKQKNDVARHPRGL